MTVSVSPAELMFTDSTAKTVTITLKLPLGITPQTPMPSVDVSANDSGYVVIGTPSAWTGTMVSGGTLTKTVSITPDNNGVTTITVTAGLNGVTKTATISAIVDIEG